MKKAVEKKWSAVLLVALICCGTSFAMDTPQKPEDCELIKRYKG